MSKTPAKKPTKTKTTPYDIAEHLRTPEEMAAYLDAWFEEAPDDAAGIARALGDIARAKGMTHTVKVFIGHSARREIRASRLS